MDDNELEEMMGKDDEPVDEPVEEPEQQEAETGEQEATPAPDKLAELEAQVEELRKINNGLLQAKTASSSKAAKAQEELRAAQERLSQFEEQLKRKEEEPETQNQKIDRLKVEFDEDGNPYIPMTDIPIPKAMQQKVHQLEQQLSATTQDLRRTQAERDQAASLQQFLGQKEGYDQAFVQVKEQWEYVKNELFDQFVSANNIPAPASAADALEIASMPEFRKAFNAKYPNADIETIMEAGLYDNPYYVRKALDRLVEKKQPASTHKPVTNKPSSVASMTDAGPPLGETDDLQQFADMSMEEFLSLSPAQEARLDSLLKQKGI